MRTLALLVSTTLSVLSGFAQANAELSQIQTVYLMPMGSGFDQYLANRLRAVNQIRVVTDVSKADAIFTDKLGAAFEARMEEIESTSKEKTEPPPNVAEKDSVSSGIKLAPRAVSSIGRGRGTYFLVDRRSRIVLWSTYSKPKDVMPKTLDRNAEKIAEELGREFSGKKK